MLSSLSRFDCTALSFYPVILTELSKRQAAAIFFVLQYPESRNNPAGGGTGCTQTAGPMR